MGVFEQVLKDDRRVFIHCFFLEVWPNVVVFVISLVLTGEHYFSCGAQQERESGESWALRKRDKLEYNSDSKLNE